MNAKFDGVAHPGLTCSIHLRFSSGVCLLSGQFLGYALYPRTVLAGFTEIGRLNFCEHAVRLLGFAFLLNIRHGVCRFPPGFVYLLSCSNS